MTNIVLVLAILVPGVGFGAAIAYLTAGPASVSPGTRVWHRHAVWRWFTWKVMRH
jgi:hypothetical protein